MTRPEDPSTPCVTRLAPSPTGALHLGNARTFLINWALAKQRGWRIVLRIEDLDTPRTKKGADVLAIEDLAWLGLEWDDGPVYQAADLSSYQEALTRLAGNGRIYPCVCTRKQVLEALSAPQEGAHERRYPGTCRPKTPMQRQHHAHEDEAWRIIIPEDDIAFHDEVAGPQCFSVQAQVGDFLVATKTGLPAYQLAVTVDDARQGVTDVVRGDDLLDSTARQLWLYRLLNLTPPRRWWHLPLVVGEDGRRLAKRHGDTRLAGYREAGVPAERIIGLLASWSGVTPRPEAMDAAEFAGRFEVGRLPRGEVVFTAEEDAWLRG